MGPSPKSSFHLADVMAARWQLLLLAIAAVALSIASGWTTWDGITNFTDNFVLSFLITLGIQGVMLIAAWLIGETFADGELPRRGRPLSKRRLGSAYVLLCCATVFIAACIALVAMTPPVGIWLLDTISAISFSLLVQLVAALAFAALILTLAFNTSDGPRILHKYWYSSKVILENLPLWLMFLVCMTASVFFSFDSLFDKIFSGQERAQVAHMRVKGQVAGILSSVSQELSRQQRQATDALFASRGWVSYETSIAELRGLASKASEMLRNRQLEREDAWQEQLASSHKLISTGSARLDDLQTQKSRLRRELDTIDQAVVKAEDMVRRHEDALNSKQVELLTMAADAKSEAAGLGASKRVGKGPRFRELKRSEKRLEIAVSLRASLRQDALDAVMRLQQKRVVVAKRIADVGGSLDEFKARIDRSKARVKALEAAHRSPQRSLAELAVLSTALVAAKDGFLRNPSAERFERLQQGCNALRHAVQRLNISTGTIASVRPCNAGLVSLAIQDISAANAVSAAHARSCGENSKLDGRTADDLMAYAQNCLLLSGLTSAAALSLQGRLQETSLRRDDRAHRFIVTWNAFLDRNPLAILAFFIAVAIDGMVFMSGLFGASVRSRYASAGMMDMASDREAGSEAILAAALMPDQKGRSLIVLRAVTHGSDEPGIAGYVDVSKAATSEVVPLRDVLGAATICDLAVRREAEGFFAVRPRLLELLSRHLGFLREPNSGLLVEVDREGLLAASLEIHGAELLRLMLRVARPLLPGQMFSHEIDLQLVEEADQGRLVPVLNAGIAMECVAPDPESCSRFLIGPTFFPLVDRISRRAARPFAETALPLASKEPVYAGRDEQSLSRNAPIQEPCDESISERDWRIDGAYLRHKRCVNARTSMVGETEPTHAADVKASSRLFVGTADAGATSASSNPSKKLRQTARPFTDRSDKGELLTFDPAKPCGSDEVVPDRQMRARISSASRSLRLIRSQDLEFDERIAKIEERYAGADFAHDTKGKSAQATFNNCTLREAIAWCTDFVARWELAATLSAVSPESTADLREIEACVCSFMLIDGEQRSDWNDLACRIKGLRELRRSHAELADFMP